MKALIVPSRFTTDIHKRNLYKTKNIIKSLVKLKVKNILSIFKDHLLNTESYFYSQFPKILGKENVYIVGNLYKEYNNKFNDQYSRYPSLNKNQISLQISYKFVKDNINLFDFILVGIRSGNIGKKIIQIAKKKDIPVIILDYFDDQNVYMDHSLIHRGLKHKHDFDLFFKHDIPINYFDDFTFPLAPMPIDPESYPNFDKKDYERKYDIFYRGRDSHGPRNDRIFLTNILKKEFKNSKIEVINSYKKISIENYCKNFAESKFAFSPSGKVWDSTRHTETAIYNNIPIIPIPDCRLSSDKKITNNHAIIYDPLRVIKDYNYLKDIIEQIKYINSNERIFSEMSLSWKKFVYDNHVLIKKSNYIIEIIKSLIK